MKILKKHRWDTIGFIKRTKKLNRENLENLYPSESWAIYRLIADSNSTLDLGCGNGAMSQIVKKINKKCKYFGVDHQKELINLADRKYTNSKFFASDLNKFLSAHKKHYDTVMLWSVIKSFKNWRKIISSSLKLSKKYLVFDVRVVKKKVEIFNVKNLNATYSNVKGSQLYLGYNVLKNFLKNIKNDNINFEIVAYNSPWGNNVYFKNRNYEKTFIVTVVIKKFKKKLKFYEQIPEELKYER